MSWTWFFMEAGKTMPSQVLLHILQADSLGFRIKGQHDKELHHHHGREQDKRDGPGTSGHNGEHGGNESVHEPMREAPEALTFGAYQIREHLAEVNPNDGVLGEGERGDESDQQPEQ